MHAVKDNMYTYIQFLYDISGSTSKREKYHAVESQTYSLRERLLFFYEGKVIPAFCKCTGELNVSRLHEQLLESFFVQQMLHHGREKGAGLSLPWHDSLTVQEIGWYIESCLKTLYHMGGTLDTTYVLDKNDYVVR